MKDLIEGLEANAELQRAWSVFELGMPAPDPLYYSDTVDLLREATLALRSTHAYPVLTHDHHI